MIRMYDRCESPVACGSRARGFTLLEILLAVSILAVVSAITYVSFTTVVTAWRRGVALAEDLHHGDYVMDQLVMALRSTYFPETGAKSASRYGFSLEDDGDGEQSSDTISWVKLGGSLVGEDCPFVGSPHRVRFFVGDSDDGERGAMVAAWRLEGQPEEFDPDEDVTPVFLSREITGFNCRTLVPENVTDEGEVEWQDEWEYTNDVPLAVELTLYLTPLEEGGDPIEVKRVVQVPVAYLCEPWERTAGR